VSFPEPKFARTGFTLVEMLVATAVFALFAATVLPAWSALQARAFNMTAFAQRQSDQMRVMDYLKRDIRRAGLVEIYNAGVIVTDNSLGDEIRLTIPDYYTDARAEDDILGPRVANDPVMTAGTVGYGSNLMVRYHVSNGAILREEGATTQTVADSAGAFSLSVGREASDLIRGRIFFDQSMRGGSQNRTLRRQVDFLCGQRAKLQS